MSSNNQLILKKNKKGKWNIFHVALDCGTMKDKFPEFDNLEDAVKEANRFEMEQEYGIEYGLKIIF